MNLAHPGCTKHMSNHAESLIDTLKAIPRTLVGDGKSPNVHFVTNCTTGEVVALFVGDGSNMVDAAIALADDLDEAHMVEDRLNGVVHDNAASDRLHERLRRAEEGEHFDRCPHCGSDNIANHDAPENGGLRVTCHACSYQWTETGHEGNEPGPNLVVQST